MLAEVEDTLTVVEPFPDASDRSKLALVMLPVPSPEIMPPTANGPLTEFLAVSNMTNWPNNRLLGGTLAVMVTVSSAVLVGSVVEAAVIVTVLPAGTEAGAVNVVAAPLAVCAGEKVPHAPGPPQLTVQSTPASAVSLATVATRGAPLFAIMEPVGTPCVIVTEIGATIVTFRLALTCAPVAVAEAVMITPPLGVRIPGGGGVGGAVKIAAAPLAVCVGEIEPHGLPPQLTDHVTPEFVVSFETTAMTVAAAFVSIVLGGTCVMLMEMAVVTVNEVKAL